MQAKQRLYLTKDKSRLVDATDKRRAFLYAVPGDEIPQSAAERFGLVDGRLKGAAAKEAKVDDEKEPAGKKASGGKAATKQAAEPKNKEAGAGEDK